MRISDWSSDVCSSDLFSSQGMFEGSHYRRLPAADGPDVAWIFDGVPEQVIGDFGLSGGGAAGFELDRAEPALGTPPGTVVLASSEGHGPRSEEHTSELQSLMRISYAVFCLKKKNTL